MHVSTIIHFFKEIVDFFTVCMWCINFPCHLDTLSNHQGGVSAREFRIDWTMAWLGLDWIVLKLIYKGRNHPQYMAPFLSIWNFEQYMREKTEVNMDMIH